MIAGMLRARADASFAMPDFLGLQRTADRFGSRSGRRPFRQSGVTSHRIEDARTIDTSGLAGREYAGLRALAKTALARKLKHSKGFNCHYTFGTGTQKESNQLLGAIRSRLTRLVDTKLYSEARPPPVLRFDIRGHKNTLADLMCSRGSMTAAPLSLRNLGLRNGPVHTVQRVHALSPSCLLNCWVLEQIRLARLF